jgi:hypothetical protein
VSARLLRWAAAIMLVLGIGHLLVAALIDGARMSGWLRDGLWATVPLIPEHTVEELATVAAFWGGFASFAVPLVLLGCLVWHLAGRGVPVPAWVGWGLSVWCAFGGIVLVPSPFFLGVVPGVLIVLAAHRDREPAASATSGALPRWTRGARFGSRDGQPDRGGRHQSP